MLPPSRGTGFASVKAPNMLIPRPYFAPRSRFAPQIVPVRLLLHTCEPGVSLVAAAAALLPSTGRISPGLGLPPRLSPRAAGCT